MWANEQQRTDPAYLGAARALAERRVAAIATAIEATRTAYEALAALPNQGADHLHDTRIHLHAALRRLEQMGTRPATAALLGNMAAFDDVDRTVLAQLQRDGVPQL